MKHYADRENYATDETGRVEDDYHNNYKNELENTITDLKITLSESNSHQFTNALALAAKVGIGHLVDVIKNGTDYNRDIDISAGFKMVDSTGEKILISAAKTKEIDAPFGTGNGGMYIGGSLDPSTTYHLMMIEKDSNLSIDYYYDTSITASHIPTGYTRWARIWSVVTNSSSNILNFLQFGKYLLFKARQLEFNGIHPASTNRITKTFDSIPTGLNLKIDLHVYAIDDGVDSFIIFKNPDETDVAPSITNADILCSAGYMGGGWPEGNNISKITNASKQITYRSSNTTVTMTGYIIGYEDYAL